MLAKVLEKPLLQQASFKQHWGHSRLVPRTYMTYIQSHYSKLWGMSSFMALQIKFLRQWETLL
jgi:hypothetical protein